MARHLGLEIMGSNLTLRLIFTLLALLVFAAGSILVVVSLLGNAPNSTNRGDLAEGASIVLFLLWPFTLFVVWLLSAAAFVMAQRWASALLLILIFIGIYAFVVGTLIFIGFIAQNFGANQLPARGIPAILIVLLFIALNTGAIYFAWRFIIQGNTNTFLP